MSRSSCPEVRKVRGFGRSCSAPDRRGSESGHGPTGGGRVSRFACDQSQRGPTLPLARCPKASGGAKYGRERTAPQVSAQPDQPCLAHGDGGRRGHRAPAHHRGLGGRRTGGYLGEGRRLRVQRQLGGQHGQRLLRRTAVQRLHLGGLRRHAVRAARRPRHPRPADRRRREGAGRPGPRRLAHLFGTGGAHPGRRRAGGCPGGGARHAERGQPARPGLRTAERARQAAADPARRGDAHPRAGQA